MNLKKFEQESLTEFNQFFGVEAKYDLTGMICHYGSMTFGHYYSVVKNQFDNTWYKYDDHTKIPITKHQIPKHNAYILFYQRKDSIDKNMNEVYPSNFNIFPGLPVNTQFGQGFVVGP